MGQKEPPRLGSTICYGQELARKSNQDSAVRFVTAKRGPEKATETRQCYLLRPRDWPERATKIRQYVLLRPNVCQKEPPRLGSTICYGQQKEPPRLGSTMCYCQMWARKSHQDSAVRFVTAKRATETRQHDLSRPRVGQKEPPRLGSTICYGQELARKSHQDSAVRFVTAKRGPERATKTRQYDLLRPRVGQKEPPRLSSTICCGQTWARKSHQDSDLLRPSVGQKKPPRLGSAICYGHEIGQKEPPRLGSTFCYGQTCARKSHQDSAVRFVTAKSWPERATKTRQYDLLRPRVGQKEPPSLGSTICYGQELARKSHRDSAVRFDTANRKGHRDSAVRFVTAKRGPERATKTRQSGLLRPRVGQNKPPGLGSTICYGQTWARKSHQDSAVRLVTAKRGPERVTETRQYDLLRPRVGQKEPPRLGSTI